MSIYTLSRNAPSPAAAAAPSPSSSAAAVSATEGRSVKLTRREIEVLTLVIEGKSSQQVADHLFVSKRTVDFHLANIYGKLNVSNRVQAFREATRRGLIPYQVVTTRQ